MGSVLEEKMRIGGGLLSGSGAAPSSILEEMKLLKELQDHSGLFFPFLVFFSLIFEFW